MLWLIILTVMAVVVFILFWRCITEQDRIGEVVAKWLQELGK